MHSSWNGIYVSPHLQKNSCGSHPRTDKSAVHTSQREIYKQRNTERGREKERGTDLEGSAPCCDPCPGHHPDLWLSSVPFSAHHIVSTINNIKMLEHILNILKKGQKSCEPISELPSITCHMKSNNVTCYQTQVNVRHLNPNQTDRLVLNS